MVSLLKKGFERYITNTYSIELSIRCSDIEVVIKHRNFYLVTKGIQYYNHNFAPKIPTIKT